MLPIGKDTILVVVEGHISVGLFESMQRLLAEGITMSAIKCSDKIRQICCPPSFALNLYQRGLTSTQVGTHTHTITFGCGCAPGDRDVTHEKSGSPTIALFPPPGMAKRPFTPNFNNTASTGTCNVTVAWIWILGSFSTMVSHVQPLMSKGVGGKCA